MFFKRYKVFNSRRFKRLKANFLVKHQLAGIGGIDEQPIVSNAKDISGGGVRFWTERFWPEGTLLKLSTHIPDLDKEIEAFGRVVRSRRAPNTFMYYVSVSFVQIEKDQQKELIDYIDAFTIRNTTRHLVDHQTVAMRLPQPQ